MKMNLIATLIAALIASGINGSTQKASKYAAKSDKPQILDAQPLQQESPTAAEDTFKIATDAAQDTNTDIQILIQEKSEAIVECLNQDIETTQTASADTAAAQKQHNEKPLEAMESSNAEVQEHALEVEEHQKESDQLIEAEKTQIEEVVSEPSEKTVPEPELANQAIVIIDVADEKQEIQEFDETSKEATVINVAKNEVVLEKVKESDVKIESAPKAAPVTLSEPIPQSSQDDEKLSDIVDKHQLVEETVVKAESSPQAASPFELDLPNSGDAQIVPDFADGNVKEKAAEVSDNTQEFDQNAREKEVEATPQPTLAEPIPKQSPDTEIIQEIVDKKQAVNETAKGSTIKVETAPQAEPVSQYSREAFITEKLKSFKLSPGSYIFKSDSPQNVIAVKVSSDGQFQWQEQPRQVRKEPQSENSQIQSRNSARNQFVTEKLERMKLLPGHYYFPSDTQGYVIAVIVNGHGAFHWKEISTEQAQCPMRMGEMQPGWVLEESQEMSSPNYSQPKKSKKRHHHKKSSGRKHYHSDSY